MHVFVQLSIKLWISTRVDKILEIISLAQLKWLETTRLLFFDPTAIRAEQRS